VFVTVLHLQLERTIVLRALEYYQVNSARAATIMEVLKKLLESGVADGDIGRQWGGYDCGNRIVMLRGLVRFFDSMGVTQSIGPGRVG
jgi:hypothetical protein